MGTATLLSECAKYQGLGIKELSVPSRDFDVGIQLSSIKMSSARIRMLFSLRRAGRRLIDISILDIDCRYIDKEILENIDIDKILNQLEFGISNRATSTGSARSRSTSFGGSSAADRSLHRAVGVGGAACSRWRRR